MQLAQKGPITNALINLIARTVHIDKEDQKFNLVEWEIILEHAVYQGYDVAQTLANINDRLPEGVKPIRIQSIEEHLISFSIIENTTGDCSCRRNFYRALMAIHSAMYGD